MQPRLLYLALRQQPRVPRPLNGKTLNINVLVLAVACNTVVSPPVTVAGPCSSASISTAHLSHVRSQNLCYRIQVIYSQCSAAVPPVHRHKLPRRQRRQALQHQQGRCQLLRALQCRRSRLSRRRCCVCCCCPSCRRPPPAAEAALHSQGCPCHCPRPCPHPCPCPVMHHASTPAVGGCWSPHGTMAPSFRTKPHGPRTWAQHYFGLNDIPYQAPALLACLACGYYTYGIPGPRLSGRAERARQCLLGAADPLYT